MIFRLFVFLFATFLAFNAGAQEFSFKQIKKSFPLSKSIKLSNLPLNTFSQAQELPLPGMMFAKNKEIVDKLRKETQFNFLYKQYQETPQLINPKIGNGFNGHPAGSRGIPNDNNMAISNDGWIVSVQNSIVRVFNPNGEPQMIRTLEFMPSGQVGRLERSFDPKVVYDPISDRFILVFLEGNTSKSSKIVVGFSQSNLPLEKWNFYALDGSPFEDKRWSDYPIIAFNESDLFVTVNMLEDGGSWIEDFAESVIWQISLEDGYNGKEVLSASFLSEIKFNEEYIWSVCPVRFGSKPNTDKKMHFLSVRPGDLKNDTIFLHTVTGSVKGNVDYEVEQLQAPIPYGIPPSGVQPNQGKGLHTNDARILDAIEEDNKIQFVQTTNISDKNIPGIYHGIIDLKTKGVQANYIFSDTMDYAYPSIAFAGNSRFKNASVITFSHSSTSQYPGTSAIFYNQLRGLEGIYSEIIKVKNGGRTIDYNTSDTNVRWGDYTSIQTKYNQEGIVWLSGAFGDTNQPKGYGTWIAQLKVNPILNALLPEEQMIIYPNPSREVVQTKFLLKEAKTLQVLVYNSLGQKVYESNAEFIPEGIFYHQFSTDRLSKGGYTLCLQSLGSEIISAQKFIIQ